MKTYSYLKSNLKSFALTPLVYLRSTNFCIWHTGRCGSTILSSMLKQHPKIYCAEEILEVYSKRYVNSKNELEGWSEGKRIIRHKMLNGGTKVSGFEMKLFHLSRLEVRVSEAMNFLDQLNFNKHIVLERQNYLRVIVSIIVARNNLKYHIDSGKKSTLTTVYIAPEMMNSLMCEFSNFYAELKRLLGENCLWLLYEKDLLNAPNIAYEKVTNFLQLKSGNPKITLGRTNPYPLEKMISNFDEISSVLKGTAYEWMLKDTL